ncbi:hypothetical protein ACA910_000719 [Epithemia clementina (nom. ined.)]
MKLTRGGWAIATRNSLLFLRNFVWPSIAIQASAFCSPFSSSSSPPPSSSARTTVTSTIFTNRNLNSSMSLSSSAGVEPPSSRSSSSSSSCWEDWREQALERAILPLSEQAHKGSSGRVAVLGGSAMYTGAPFYAAMASLKAGADLAYVLTAEEASLPIKCYSPELMVAPVYCAKDFDRVQQQQEENNDKDEEASSKLQKQKEQLVNEMVKTVMNQIGRAHCLVVGPGLGRSPMVFEAVAKIIQEARKMDLHMVLDADALFMLTLPQFRTILQGYDKAILTPNAMEYKRLFPDGCTAAAKNDDDNDFPFQNVVLVRKGQNDVIERNGMTHYVCREMGGLKRSGGIGDVLAGTLGTLVAWKAILEEKQQQQAQSESSSSMSDLPLSCWTACCFVKRATALAYRQYKRSMTAPDVLEHLGPAIDEMTTL